MTRYNEADKFPSFSRDATMWQITETSPKFCIPIVARGCSIFPQGAPQAKDTGSAEALGANSRHSLNEADPVMGREGVGTCRP